jgi:hypothetical protein
MAAICARCGVTTRDGAGELPGGVDSYVGAAQGGRLSPVQPRHAAEVIVPLRLRAAVAHVLAAAAQRADVPRRVLRLLREHARQPLLEEPPDVDVIHLVRHRDQRGFQRRRQGVPVVRRHEPGMQVAEGVVVVIPRPDVSLGAHRVPVAQAGQFQRTGEGEGVEGHLGEMLHGGFRRALYVHDMDFVSGRGCRADCGGAGAGRPYPQDVRARLHGIKTVAFVQFPQAGGERVRHGEFGLQQQPGRRVPLQRFEQVRWRDERRASQLRVHLVVQRVAGRLPRAQVYEVLIFCGFPPASGGHLGLRSGARVAVVRQLQGGGLLARSQLEAQVTVTVQLEGVSEYGFGESRHRFTSPAAAPLAVTAHGPRLPPRTMDLFHMAAHGAARAVHCFDADSRGTLRPVSALS